MFGNKNDITLMGLVTSSTTSSWISRATNLYFFQYLCIICTFKILSPGFSSVTPGKWWDGTYKI